MAKPRTIEIGGIRIKADFDPGPNAKPYLVDTGSPHLTVETLFAHTRHAELSLVFDSGGLWKLYADDESKRFEFVSPAFGPRPYRVATISSDWTHASITVDDSLKGVIADPLEYPLDELLFMNLVNRHGGIEVHACGLSVEGRGLLFVGHSGAGKSTTAKLWMEQYPDACVLSDDRVIVRHDSSGCLRMWGTPWHGEARLSAATSAPLDGVFILRQAQENKVRKLPAAGALAEILSRCFYPVYDPWGARKATGFAASVAEEVPVFDLSFRRDPGAVRVALAC